MNSARPVTIVSAFGRGQGLAARLQRLEIPVLLVDVSESLGATAPEDEEGPFGFLNAGMNHVQLERLHQDDPPLAQSEGWVFVLESGPFEMKSSLSRWRAEKLGLSPDFAQTLKQAREGQLRSLSQWMQFDLEQSWLLEMASSIASNQLRPYPHSMTVIPPLPLDSDFSIRQVTRPGLLQSLEWCERQGVEVKRNWIIKNIARERRGYWKGLQVQERNSETTHLLPFEQLIWCLSSEETAFLGEAIADKLLPEGSIGAEWLWTRFRLRLGDSPERRVLPNHSCWIQDLDLPWTHENLILLQKSPARDLLDAWIRIPAEPRLQKSYLSERLQRVQQVLADRFVTVEPLKAEEPLGAERTTREVGPPRWPLFSPEKLLTWRPAADRNLHWHAPEFWNGLGWNAQARHEEKLVPTLEAWWQRREELRRKKELKEKGAST